MKIVTGTQKGRIGSEGKLTTQTVHVVFDYSDKTECGVEFSSNPNLTFPKEGTAEQVTCKRCIRSLKYIRYIKD